MKLRRVYANFVLLPASKIYGLVTWMRNKLFDWNILKQHTFGVPVVVVGNLVAGGSGKTPHTEYLVDGLRHSYHLAVLSRGYKRSTKGFVMASAHSTPRDIGDEPYQMYHKFGGQVPVFVCEDRVRGINELLKVDSDVDLVILDDAFQHRYVKPTVSVLITEFAKPLYSDKLLPYGRLRESVRGLYRADVVVDSKCSDAIKPVDCRILKNNLNLYPPPSQYLFFSRYNYCTLKPLFPAEVTGIPHLEWLEPDDAVLILSGIGNPRPFVRQIKSYRAKVKINVYPDHHNYTRKDIDNIRRRYDSLRGKRRLIITTEKDAVRLSTNPYFPHELKAVTYYLPIEVDFLRFTEKETFVDTVRELLRQRKGL